MPSRHVTTLDSKRNEKTFTECVIRIRMRSIERAMRIFWLRPRNKWNELAVLIRLSFSFARATAMTDAQTEQSGLARRTCTILVALCHVVPLRSGHTKATPAIEPQASKFGLPFMANEKLSSSTRQPKNYFYVYIIYNRNESTWLRIIKQYKLDDVLLIFGLM